MKNIFHLILATLLLLLQQNLPAQETITGNLDNWKGAEAKILSISLFSDETRNFGKVDEEGNFEIPLEENFLTKIKKEMEKEQENRDDGAILSMKKLKESFSCDRGDLEYENADIEVTGLPQQLFIISDNEKGGILMPVSNPDIARHRASFGQENLGKGKAVFWVYLDEEAAVNGECYSNSFAGDSVLKENRQFELDFKKGWNLVEYEILETFEDKTGKVHAKEVKWNTVDKVPDEVKWTFIPLKR